MMIQFTEIAYTADSVGFSDLSEVECNTDNVRMIDIRLSLNHQRLRVYVGESHEELMLV